MEDARRGKRKHEMEMPFQKPTAHLLATDLFWSGMAAQLQLSTCCGGSNKREECPNSLWVGGLGQTLKNPQCSPLEPNSVNHFCSQEQLSFYWEKIVSISILINNGGLPFTQKSFRFLLLALVDKYLPSKIVSGELSYIAICIGRNADEKESCIKEESPVFGRVMHGLVF